MNVREHRQRYLTLAQIELRSVLDNYLVWLHDTAEAERRPLTEEEIQLTKVVNTVKALEFLLAGPDEDLAPL